MPETRIPQFSIALPGRSRAARMAAFAGLLMLTGGLGGCGMFGAGGGKPALDTHADEVLAPASSSSGGATSAATPQAVNSATAAYVARMKSAMANAGKTSPPAQANAGSAGQTPYNAKAAGANVTTAAIAGAPAPAKPVAVAGGGPGVKQGNFPAQPASGAANTQAMVSMKAGGTVAKLPPKAPPTAARKLSLAAVLGMLRQRAAMRPSVLQYAAAVGLLDTLEKHGAASDPALGALAANDRKIVTGVARAVALIAERPGVDAQSLAQRAGPLIRAVRRMADHAPLTLPRLVLCSRVQSFGVYTKIGNKFTYGHRHTVIIYCEVAHFQPKKSARGWYVTRLSQQDTLMTNDGLLIWRPNAENVEDRSMDRRHDFYLVKKMTIPDNLAVGQYTLRMSVTDRQTHQIAQANLPIKIVR